MSRLGPLVATGDGSRLDAADGRSCRFGPAGVQFAGADGRQEVLGWADVHGVVVEAPTNRRWLRAAPAILLAVSFRDTSGVSVRSREVTVSVTGRWGDGPSVDLGRPAEAPYRARELDALDVLLDVLGSRRQLPVLGAAGPVAELLDAAGEAASRRLPGGRRVRAAVTGRLAGTGP